MSHFKKKTVYSLFTLTGFICGLLAGIISFSLLASSRINSYKSLIKLLETKVEERDVQFETLNSKLEEAIKNKKIVLKDINIALLYEGDEFDKITVEKYIKNKFTHLLGNEITNINLDTVSEVIDKRIFIIDNRHYSLTVTRITLSEKLKLFIKVKSVSTQ